MKSLIIRQLAFAIALMAAGSSCIYESPDDEFYRTLWKTDAQPFGEMTVDFLCGNEICIKAEAALFDDYGTYTSSGMTATFEDLFLIVDDKSYIIDGAVRDRDLLYLHWHPANSREVNTSQMYGLSAYE